MGLLPPETIDTRYEKFDHPIIEEKVASLTKQQAKVQYADAESDAVKQTVQMQQMIDAGLGRSPGRRQRGRSA
ncbi:hypothetical protein [Streptomyces shenzhenensis]|uniref:Uncharacterized protein n=1 Tax=Streptomyces shenzhenensis TaxID=943815 RepID=A0A3M0I2P8_9ACTN|nr:hypothetical protein CTZ28_22860 [Streptomyces shenzhenensis]